jgi:hypothetical protein
MDRASLSVALCVGVCVIVASVAVGAEPAVPAPFTAKDTAAFEELYKARIDKAQSRRDKEALAKELLEGAAPAGPGLKYLMLAAAAELARDGLDFETAVKAQEQLVALKAGDRKALLRERVDLQLKHFHVLRRKRVPPKERLSMKKILHALGGSIVEGAIELANTHRGALEYDQAEEVEKLALVPARLISSPRLGQLRQGIQVSQTLKGLVARAEGFQRTDRLAEAVWAYLDAGLYGRATALKPPEPDATAQQLIRAAAAGAKPGEILEAAKAWDRRATEARPPDGPLAQIRLARAAELYERYMDVGDEANRKIAKIRLQAIERKLGDLLAALRAPTEWVYLVDLKEVSAKVGWGSFGKTTVAKGPIGIAGRKFSTGLNVHAFSRVVYSLRGQYKVFSTCYGLGTGAGGAASFEIVCDGKVVWKSGGMWSNHTHGVRKPVVINVTGVDKLELVTRAIRGGAGAFSKWGEPKLR